MKLVESVVNFAPSLSASPIRAACAFKFDADRDLPAFLTPALAALEKDRIQIRIGQMLRAVECALLDTFAAVRKRRDELGETGIAYFIANPECPRLSTRKVPELFHIKRPQRFDACNELRLELSGRSRGMLTSIPIRRFDCFAWKPC